MHALEVQSCILILNKDKVEHRVYLSSGRDERWGRLPHVQTHYARRVVAMLIYS